MAALEYEERSGWLTFAAILMFAVGFVDSVYPWFGFRVGVVGDLK